jgi:hypothetical protein
MKITNKGGSLLDEVLPTFDISASYSVRIRATPQRIYNVLQEGIPTGAITKILMIMRGLPRIARRQKPRPAQDAFYRLMQLKDREIVIGIVGQFWKPVSDPVPIRSLDEFLAFDRIDFSKAALNLKIIPIQARECRVTTETRVLSYGRAKQDFKSYWQMIAPFSGMIRKEILRKIKKKAEDNRQGARRKKN